MARQTTSGPHRCPFLAGISAWAWRRARAFLRDRRGGVALWVGLSAVPLLFLAGAGLDLSRTFNQQTQIQGAVDAAALAGASAYVSSTSVGTARAAATNYMNQFKASSGLTSLTFTVTPGTVTSGSSVTLYKMTVSASATILNTLMAMAKNANPINVTATAQNPVYNITINLAGFSSSASDLDAVSYYVVPADNSVPPLSATTQIFSNASGSSNASVTVQLTASQKLGFMLTNTTGGNSQTVCAVVLFIKTCRTVSDGYGYNQYGGAQGSVHYFYSHLSPPSQAAYPWVTQNCSLQVTTGSVSPGSGSCYGSLPTYATVNCVKASGLTLNYSWNDMGGPIDDRDYNDADYTVTCSKVDGSVSKGLVLTN